MNKLCLHCLLIMCLCINMLNAQSIVADKIVAVIDNKIILKSDVAIQRAQLEAQGNNEPLPADVDCFVLQQLLTQKLLVAQANKDSVLVSTEEVEAELERRMNYFISQIGSKEKFEEYYKKPIIKWKEEFRLPVEEQLQAQRMQQKAVGEVKVSPVEVRNYFNLLPKDSLPAISSEIEVGIIVLNPTISLASKNEAKQQLLTIKKRIEGGINFDSQAKLYSEDPGSAGKGGDLGLVSRGEMVPEFESALFKLKDGELSDIVESPYGYHLIKMVSRQGSKAKAKHILIAAKSSKEDLTAAVKKLDSIRNLIVKDSMSFKAAADKYSTDEATKGNGGLMINPATGTTLLETNQVEADIFFMVDTMKINQISKPHIFKLAGNQEAARILILRSKTLPHIANLKEDYQKIHEIVVTQKQQELMLKWIKKTVQKNYIRIDDEYKNCQQLSIYFQKEKNN
jgi:peptidyl-prolyl cis-trans isomerase SurA